ncbi:unnamed protein product [Mytilus coruscus]|uniref:C2H2-type domain-containing protein n=1 Tax=Mytilus coruscus TaxID=42192 RepID=A0A6J8DNN7_MYTCO|nr:unnamed protein product [Mytilus coruscus]
MSNPCNFSTLCNTVCSDGPTIQLFHCDRDTSSHLSLLQCSEKIPDRSGIFSIDSSALKLNICDSHREYFGIQWRRKQIRCIHQGHSEKSRSNADRGARPTLCKLYWLNTRQILPVGAGLCKKCATVLRKDVCTEQVNFENELEAFNEAKSRMEQEHNQDINSKSDQDMELAYSQSSVTGKNIPCIVHEPFTVIQTAGKVSHLKTAQHFANEHDEPSAIPENETTNACDSQTVNFFCCPDISCNKTFARATNPEKHILIGNHSYRTNKSGLDNAVEVYASISESVQDTQINLIQTVSAATQSDATSNMINKGWALKDKRTNIRFSPKVKSYLNEICLNCEKTGKRPNYFALSDELRKPCDENGERMFKMEE